ncbi:hypothetical protein [Nonomuraea sp. NPDC049784]|uniref:hypothetical protein n=1 Tax=Nonomuraea sp. NPDC049784 TaxID=3154361 RepID=UPI0033DB7DB0
MKRIHSILAVGATMGALTATAATVQAAPVQAAPAGVSQMENAGARSAPPFVAYHGLTFAQQTERFTSLRAQGYRPITVSISTDGSGGIRYAAMWSSSGRAMGSDLPWVMYQDMSSERYQRRFDQYAAQGYQPAVVSATGYGAGARFAAIFIKNPGFRFVAKHDITAGQAEGIITGGRDAELMSAAVVGGMRSVLAIVLDQDPRPDRAAVLQEIWEFSTAALGMTQGDTP